MVVCGCRKNILNDALGSGEILYRYSWLIDSYVLDFFTEDLWGKIPSNWQDVLEDLEPQELGLWLDQNKIPRYRKPWPLSLLALRSSITKLSLPRRKYCTCDKDDNPRNKQIYADPAEGSSSVSEELMHLKKPDGMRENLIHDPDPCKHFTSSFNRLIDCDSSINQQRGYIYAFQKHVKPKKRHEIFHMAKVVCQLAAKCKVSCIVDVGAGLGHLGRLLSYGHRLPTCCIESQRNLSSSAR
ncbi:hypothetical protein J437_LFUL011293 [Ladona fulva]|uniref:Methyltransferase domain-containing protein n=1 Tax=Ladona fulva TaxID=123851 RepID=A0A8K0KMZ2_LADFU|nr:hypothetical protein J437_LFUL011293 [Ladona fulva]